MLKVARCVASNKTLCSEAGIGGTDVSCVVGSCGGGKTTGEELYCLMLEFCCVGLIWQPCALKEEPVGRWR